MKEELRTQSLAYQRDTIYRGEISEDAYKKIHCQYTFSTIPPPLRTATRRVSDAGGTPQSSGTTTVIVSFSCNPSLLTFSAVTTCAIMYSCFSKHLQSKVHREVTRCQKCLGIWCVVPLQLKFTDYSLHEDYNTHPFHMMESPPNKI